MADKKIIAVVGATGAQGGGLVRAILADPAGGFAVRALTRDPNAPAAKALAEAGAEVVAADVDDPESLKRAFDGAYGAYCVTFFWEHFSPEKELAQAQAHGRRPPRRRASQHVDLVDARGHAQAGCRSTTTACRRCRASTRCRTSTPRARPTAFFTRRGRADDVPADRRSTGTTSSTSAWARRRGRTASCRSRCRWATRSCPASPPRTSARCAYGIFKAGASTIGKTVGIAGEHLTGARWPRR